MTILLLAAAAVLCAGGLIAVGFGIPIKEFSFGNTMILAGATLVGSGAIVAALAVVAGELRKLVVALDPRQKRSAATTGRRPLPGSPAGFDPAAGEDDTLSPSSSLPSWPPEVAAAIASAAGGPGQPAQAAPAPASRPFVPEPLPEPKLSFETAWPNPKPGDARPADAEPEAAPQAAPSAPPRRSELFRRTARASSLSEHPPGDGSPAGRAGPGPSASPPPAAPATPVSILKSGVVDGMAYTLFSDGSIETEMADGKVRFASIEALRTHLDQRGQ